MQFYIRENQTHSYWEVNNATEYILKAFRNYFIVILTKNIWNQKLSKSSVISLVKNHGSCKETSNDKLRAKEQPRADFVP